MRTLDKATLDVKYLLDSGYKKDSAINYVSARYDLRQSKKSHLNSIRDKDVIVGGYNVLITMECLMFSLDTVIPCTDGFIRDASDVFGKYIFTDRTDAAILNIINILEKYNPLSITFIFESQVSKSGDLCRNINTKYGKDGHVKSIIHKTVDSEIIRLNRITATSDSVIIERVDEVIDVPGYAYECDLNVRNLRGSSVL